MVRKHLNSLTRLYKVSPLLEQGFDYYKHLLIVYLVIKFCGAYSLREVIHYVLGFVYSGLLWENPSYYPI
jgi:hypothetical protein